MWNRSSTHFGGIVPCGISASHYGVTSLVDLGHPITMSEFDSLLRAEFEAVFGPTSGVEAELAGEPVVAAQ